MLKNNICYIIFYILLLCSIGATQSPQPEKIRNFKGMDTRLPDFSRPNNIPTELINVDLSKLGSYGSRDGYSNYYTPEDIDSIIGIQPVSFSDGQEWMLALVDPDDSQWGKLIAFENADAKRVDTFWVARTNCMTTFGDASVVLPSTLKVRMVDTINFFSNEITFDIDEDFGLIPDEQSFADTLYNMMDEATAASFAVVFDSTAFDSTTYTDTVMIRLYYAANRGETYTIFYGNSNDPNCLCESGKYPVSCNSFVTEAHGMIPPAYTTIFSRMPITNSFDAEVMNDVVYFASGTISQVTWDRQNTSLTPPLRPAELWPAQFPKPSGSTANYYLDGEYYYAVGQLVWYDSAGTDHSKWREPYVLTGPIQVDSGYVNIMGFQAGGTFDWDDASGIYDTLGAPDSVGLYLFRTKANPSPLTANVDSLFLVQSWMLQEADVADNGFDFDTLTVVDSIPDGSLDDDTTFYAVRNGELLGKGYDYAANDDTPYSNFYGGPYYLGDRLDVDGFNGADGVNTLTGWNDTDTDTLGWVYASLYRDTLSGLCSQFGPYLTVYTARATTPKDLRPAIISQHPNSELSEHCIIEYYKAPFYGEQTAGSYAVGHWEYWTITLCDNYDPSGYDWYLADLRWRFPNQTWECGMEVSSALFPNTLPNQGRNFVFDYWQDWTALDTFAVPNVNEFLRMGTQEEDGDPQFRDTILTWDDVTSNTISHPQFRPAATPVGVTVLGRAGDRMIGSSGTRLWWSDLNNAAYWGIYNNINVGASDGSDNITGFYSARGLLRVFGEDFSYNTYGEQWTLSELSGKWGCIAPRSLSTGLQGAYFLSNQGIVFESEGGELERKYDRVLISSPIVEIEKYPRDVKRNAVGIVYDNKYMISFPDSNFTWVFDEIAEGWSKWENITMGGAGIKRDTLFFFKPNGKTIYTYGTSHLDDGNGIEWSASFAPLWVDRDEEMVTDIGLWIRDTSSVEGFSVYTFGPNNEWDIDEDGYILISANERQKIKSMAPYKRVPVATLIKLVSNSNLDNGDVYIDGLDVYYKKMNITEPE